MLVATQLPPHWPEVSCVISTCRTSNRGSGFGNQGAERNEGARVGASALAHRIPALSMWAEKVPFGLLMSYGQQDVSESLVITAGYVDKILKGAKPADLPVEQPARLKLVINLKVAKALGLNMPSTLLASADKVIE
jgi:putative ABC transport system substrate-binding protein